MTEPTVPPPIPGGGGAARSGPPPVHRRRAPEGADLVGIDLGTTHCALASLPGSTEGPASPAVLDIMQVVAPGQVAPRALLPSFIYLPGPHELAGGALALPWDPAPAFAVGAFAREQGTRVPTRAVASAKSWLSHEGVDRTAAILPWGAPAEVEKLSPVQASTAYLRHLAQAWAHAHPEGGPLEDQQVVLTVPASFDAAARDLTVRAARDAGFKYLVLLEEPQAALYAWLESHGEAWRKELGPGDVVLVCDVGGGTTDFSLIAITDRGGTLGLERLAVGDHILLGGDNMDLTLAFRVRQRIEEEQGTSLDAWQVHALTQSCRAAKERLLADPELESVPITVASRGARLLGGTLRAELGRAEVLELLVEGFFPRCPITAEPKRGRQAALQEIGLPYARDPGITRHLAAFLRRNAGAEGEPASFVAPTAVLFNGGVLKAEALKARLIEVLDGWVQEAGRPALRHLRSQSLDVSVARGAAYFAQVRRGAGIRIRAGLARGYYVGVESAAPAVPGFEPPMSAICVAPFGLEEGSEVRLDGHRLALTVGQLASFRFFQSNTRRDAVGAVISDWAPGELQELPPIETTLAAAEGEAPGTRIPVVLRAEVTEVGTLLLSCVEAREGGRSWDLEINVRSRKDEWSA